MKRVAYVFAALFACSTTGCIATSAEHGRVLTGSSDDPFVTVEAGNVQIRSGRFYARYAVDRSTQTCWLIVGSSLAAMDCCASRRVAALHDVITWESDASCSAPPSRAPVVAPLEAQTRSGAPSLTQ